MGTRHWIEPPTKSQEQYMRCVDEFCHQAHNLGSGAPICHLRRHHSGQIPVDTHVSKCPVLSRETSSRDASHLCDSPGPRFLASLGMRTDSSCVSPLVSMVQASHPWKGNYPSSVRWG